MCFKNAVISRSSPGSLATKSLAIRGTTHLLGGGIFLIMESNHHLWVCLHSLRRFVLGKGKKGNDFREIPEDSAIQSPGVEVGPSCISGAPRVATSKQRGG